MMGVSQVAASRAGGGMLTVPRDANDAVEGLAVAVVGGDDVLVARIRAAFAREGVAAHVRWPVAHADPGARAPDVVVLAVPPDHAAAPAVAAVRRRLPRAQVVLALAPGACASGAGRAIDAAPDGVVADADLDVALGMVVRCARAGYVAFPASAGEREVRPAFSPRERQVVRLVVLGLTNDEIAAAAVPREEHGRRPPDRGLPPPRGAVAARARRRGARGRGGPAPHVPRRRPARRGRARSAGMTPATAVARPDSAVGYVGPMPAAVRPRACGSSGWRSSAPAGDSASSWSRCAATSRTGRRRWRGAASSARCARSTPAGRRASS